jgi:hypothetical protein
LLYEYENASWRATLLGGGPMVAQSHGLKTYKKLIAETVRV